MICSVGVFESFGTLLDFLQNRKSMQTHSFVLLKFWFEIGIRLALFKI